MTLEDRRGNVPFGGARRHHHATLSVCPERADERMTRRSPARILPLSPRPRYFRTDVYYDSQTNGLDHGHVLHDGWPHRPRRRSPASDSVGGSVGARGSHRSRLVLFVSRRSLQVKKISLRGATVAIQGFGNAGATAARVVRRKEGKSRCLQ